jgi:hypothetical protein
MDNINTYYLDENDLADVFCKKENCNCCAGNDPGCGLREEFIENNKGLLIENALENEFYRKSDVDKIFQEYDLTVEKLNDALNSIE